MECKCHCCGSSNFYIFIVFLKRRVSVSTKMQRHLYTVRLVHEFVKRLLCCPVWGWSGRMSDKIGKHLPVLEGAANGTLLGGE